MLKKEWASTEDSLLDEIEEVEKLNEIVLGNKPTRKRLRPNRQIGNGGGFDDDEENYVVQK